MPTERALIIAGIALFAAARLALAEPLPEPTLASLHLACGDFKQNDDGSWSSVHAVKIMKSNGTGVKLGPGTSFGAGSDFGGVHLAEILHKECLSD
jgi:hypothetical protein